MNCYCYARYKEIGSDVASLKLDAPDSSEEIYPCRNWLLKYTSGRFSVYNLALFIVIMNYLVRFVALFTSECEGHHSIVAMKKSSTAKTQVFQYLVTVLLPLLVFIDFWNTSELTFLQISSIHFAAEFYSKIGAAICLAVLALSLLFPLGPVFSCRRISLCTARCRDRGCSLNRDRTKMVNYQEYVHVHVQGKVFDTESKYSKIVSLVLITMTFSASMPILYLAGFMMFLGLYVVDKVMFLRGY